MNLDLKSATIGLALGFGAWGAWYAASTRPVIQKLVQEKAVLAGQLAISDARANRLQASAQGFAQQWITGLQQSGQRGSASGCVDPYDRSTCFQVSYGPTVSSSVQSQDDQVYSTLNKIQPGWGTATKIAKTLVDKYQAQQPPKCPSGQVASRIGNQPWHCENLPAADQDVHVAGAVWTDEGSTHGCAGNQIFLSGTGCLTCQAGLHPGVNQFGNWACVLQ